MINSCSIAGNILPIQCEGIRIFFTFKIIRECNCVDREYKFRSTIVIYNIFDSNTGKWIINSFYSGTKLYSSNRMYPIFPADHRNFDRYVVKMSRINRDDKWISVKSYCSDILISLLGTPGN